MVSLAQGPSCVYELARNLHTIREPDRRQSKAALVGNCGADRVPPWGTFWPNRFIQINNSHRLIRR